MHSSRTITPLLLTSLFLSLFPAFSGAATKKQVLNGSVVESATTDKLFRCGITCASGGSLGKITVSGVHLGTAAYYGGVDVGDEIKQVVQTRNELQLLIAREGKIFQISFPMPDRKTASVEVVDVGLRNRVPLLASINGVPVREVTERTPSRRTGTQPFPVVDVTQPRRFPKPIVFPTDVDTLVDVDLHPCLCHKNTALFYTQFEFVKAQLNALKNAAEKNHKSTTLKIVGTDFSDFVMTPDDLHEDNSPKRVAEPSAVLAERLNKLFDRRRNTAAPLTLVMLVDDKAIALGDPLAIGQALQTYEKRLTGSSRLYVTFVATGNNLVDLSQWKVTAERIMGSNSRCTVFDPIQSSQMDNRNLDDIVEEKIAAANATVPRH